MVLDEIKYQTYVQILKEELVPAMGCTEPIALSYCASKARDILGTTPTRCLVEISGNIIKNVKSVIVPNTNGLKGIEAAVAAGIIAGNANKVLEVIADVKKDQIKEIKDYLEHNCIIVRPLETEHILDIKITLFDDDNEMVIDRCSLNVKDILEFANIVDLNDVKEIISRQIAYNSAIAKEGLTNNYGANIGSVLLNSGQDIITRAKAFAAAGSDARMSGCELPVVINSGSGNQGMTVSLPIIEYAKELNVNDEKLYRALVLGNLITIHQKTGIGR